MSAKALLLCFTLFASSWSCVINEQQRQFDVNEELHEGIRKFAVNLNKVMARHCEEDDNVVVSPLSVYVTLALAHLASNGDTQNEISDTMCLPKDSEWVPRIHESLGQLIQQLKSNANANVTVANGMFVQNNVQLKNDFLQRIEKCYENNVVSVDFNGDDATDTVNKWFESKTKGKIGRFFQERISRDTRLLLANALCFSGKWNRNFPRESIKRETFRLGNGREEQILMMQKTEDVPYYKDDTNQYEAIGIPYQQGEYLMWLILPHESQDLKTLVNVLNLEHIQRILDDSKTSTVDIKLPQMKLRNSDRIKNILSEMGINKLFDAPDLSNMFGGTGSESNIKVAQISHSFQMELDDKGTDVCGGTAQEYKPQSSPQRRFGDASKQFYVQRPYMFFIYHTVTKSILFHGTINNAAAPQQ